MVKNPGCAATTSAAISPRSCGARPAARRAAPPSRSACSTATRRRGCSWPSAWLAGANPGQWTLPGGKLEPGEDAVGAALRELEEEAAVAGGEVAGLLDDFVTDSGFRITPVVVLAAPGTRPRRAPEEIASLHQIRFDALLREGVPRWLAQPGGDALLQMKLRHDMVIHAPTGALLFQFREVALLGRDTRVADLRQPEWTRR